MDVRVKIQFNPVKKDDWTSMRLMAESLTNKKESIRVFADPDPEWLVAEFTMPTEAQYKAVDKIDRVMRIDVWTRWDSVFTFPKKKAGKTQDTASNIAE